MYNIGYITLLDEHTQEWTELFENSNYSINRLKLTETESFENQDVLLIRDKEASDLSFICKVLIEAKKYPEMLVYIISPSQKLEKSIKNVYFQLGVNAIKDASLEWEEFYFMIKNHVEKIVRTKTVPSEIMSKKAISKKNIELEPNSLSIWFENDEISLTRLEYIVFELLHKNAGNTVSYEQISERIWQQNSLEKKYRVANMIFNIRQKIEQSDQNSSCIKTIRSRGYMLTI